MENLEIFKQVGKKVQKIRTLKGLSQVDLVGKMEGNIDTTNISRGVLTLLYLPSTVLHRL